MSLGHLQGVYEGVDSAKICMDERNMTSKMLEFLKNGVRTARKMPTSEDEASHYALWTRSFDLGGAKFLRNMFPRCSRLDFQALATQEH